MEASWHHPPLLMPLPIDPSAAGRGPRVMVRSQNARGYSHSFQPCFGVKLRQTSRELIHQPLREGGGGAGSLTPLSGGESAPPSARRRQPRTKHREIVSDDNAMMLTLSHGPTLAESLRLYDSRGIPADPANAGNVEVKVCERRTENMLDVERVSCVRQTQREFLLNVSLAYLVSVLTPGHLTRLETLSTYQVCVAT